MDPINPEDWFGLSPEYFISRNEVGDGLLFALLNRGTLMYNNSTQEWFRWAGHHWERDIMRTAEMAVSDVVDKYLSFADKAPSAEALKNAIDQKNADTAAKEAVKGSWDSMPEEERTRLVSAERKSMERYQKIASEYSAAEKIPGRVNRLQTSQGLTATLKLATTANIGKKAILAIRGDEIDSLPWFLPCKNGVLDLKSGEFSDGRPADYLIKASPVVWAGIDAKAPLFDQALSEIFIGNQEMVDFFQRLVGMAIIGEVVMSAFIVLSGAGRNGKSMLVEVFSRVLGDLAGPIRSEMLMEQPKNRGAAGPTPDVMALKGRRLCFASETEDGGRISTARVKEFTGNDSLSGRNPHDKYETSFRPSHTLFLLTNHRPHAPADDFAFWERMILVPFEARFVDREPKPGTAERRADPDLLKKLLDEAPGILAWMVRGCLSYQAMGGLQLPAKVKAAIQEYKKDEDVIQDFIDECCDVFDGAESGASEIYAVFERWWKRRVSNFVPKQKRFGTLFGRRFEKKKDGFIKYYGVSLSPSAVDEYR